MLSIHQKTKQVLMLYNPTQTVATFNANADNYNNNQYSLTSMGLLKGKARLTLE
jgi:hypothetical protein